MKYHVELHGSYLSKALITVEASSVVEAAEAALAQMNNPEEPTYKVHSVSGAQVQKKALPIA